MARRPTMTDIAREAGVSKGAVSYALNNLPGVSDDTRSRVLAIAEAMGYTPNSAARALIGAEVGTIGLVICRPATILGVEPFFMELISGISGELSPRSVSLNVQVVADHAAEIEVYRRWWGGRHVDGVLIADVRVDDQRFDAVRQLGLPAVAIAGPGDFGGLPAVWSDDAAAVTEAAEYLAALGHRRIARIGGLPGLLHTEIRTEAFHAACGRLDVEALTVNADYTAPDGRRATRRVLSMSPAPTAIIYDNDIMAVAGMAVAKEMGVVVPDDVSMIAWDDSTLCNLVHPPLTALSRDVAGYGALAARTLTRLISEGSADSAQHDTAYLVARGSTARPAGAGGRQRG
jgi:DNA-binding LacI/PurR family transcriptional regulator